jgi:Ser-tRNA(Ala) deacylase AlaX
MVRPAYERDPYLTELDTEVVSVGGEGDQPFAVTADTVFYPEGGGQPCDLGTMGGVDVVEVRKIGEEIRHGLSAPIAVGPVRQAIDWPRRYDHMQQHTGQHIVTAVALARFGWPTTAFHLGPEVSDIELDVPSLERVDLDRLEDVVNAEVRAAHPVTVGYESRAQMEKLGVRSRLLPHDFEEEEIRVVEIRGVDLNTCGGTHVGSTAEIGSIVFLGTEPMRGGTRVFFVAGDRVRRRLVAHELRNARLRELLDSADDDLPEIVGLRIDREKRLARDRRRFAEELAEAVATAMAETNETVVARHWDDGDMEFLQKLGRRLIELAPGKVALLTAGSGRDGVFVVAAGDQATVEVAEIGFEVAALLEGRGGGTRGIFQGKASALSHRERAAALLRDRCGS